MKEIKIGCEGARNLDPALLNPLQGNLKDLSKKNYAKLKKQILELGFSEPFSVWDFEEKTYVLNGHQRLRVIHKMMEEGYSVPALPCNNIHAKDMKEAKKKILSLTSQYGEMTDEGLFEFMTTADLDVEEIMDSFRFPEIDLDSFKENFFNIEETNEGNTDEDQVPDIKENELGVQLGDIWQLGRHRLMCGDSTSQQEVSVLMMNEKADMVFTDPPYGMKAVEKSAVLKKRYKPVAGDNNTDVVKKCCELIFEMNLPTVLWGANYYSSCLPDSASWLVWDKNNGGSDQVDCELAWTNLKGVVRQFTQASEKTNRVHPTQKPVSLIDWCFKKYDIGNLILDLFLGSGSTLIACEKTGRKCYGMELDPHYCSVIIKRWEEFTGQKAEKISAQE